MKDFFKVLLLIICAFGFYIGLYFLGKLNVLLLSIIGIVVSVVVILGSIFILSKNKKNRHIPLDEDEKQ
jgi:hypothetical protein